MPALSNEDCKHVSKMTQEDYLFGDYCKECGIGNGYAHDLQYTISDKDDEELVGSCNKILKRWMDYCNKNNLYINTGKTTLKKLMTRQKLQMKLIETIHLNQRDEQGNWITPKTNQKLLGTTLKNDLLWGEYLLYGEKAVMPSIKRK